MKTSKTNGLSRLLSFLLIAILLICTVGFAVNGWQSNPNDEPDSGEVGDKTDKTDENTDGSQDSTDQNDTQNQLPPDSDNSPPPIETPKFYNTITGLEIEETASFTTPLGFVLDPSAPLYGVSNCDLAIEFPVEDGTTRLLTYTTDSSLLWKIGSLTSTRAFISGMSNFFGGVVISYGNDDVVKYSAWDTSKIELDISKYSNSYYIENTLYVYTSRDLITGVLNNSNTLSKNVYKSAPFEFSDDCVTGAREASSVMIPYSATSEVSLYYSEQSEKYLYFKSGNRKMDMLTGKNVSFTNLFILFSNATTYEKAEGTELVIDTTSGGNGYYISHGYSTEIKWSINENGELIFKTLSGEKLTVNRGTSYIGYFKASNSSKVKFM